MLNHLPNDYLYPLKKEIERREVIEMWNDEALSKRENERNAKEKISEAVKIFGVLLESSLNNGSREFQELAALSALGLYSFVDEIIYYKPFCRIPKRRKPYTVQAIGGKHWRSWGKE